MKYVETHLTRHHFLRAPHKWFFAFLASPIHFLEMHYKNRYHLKFAHARKLFLFDMVLLAAVILLCTVSIFWLAFKPNSKDQMVIVVTAHSHDEKEPLTRIQSGEHITYKIMYKNTSEARLVKPTLHVRLPHGFLPDDANAPTTFTLPDLAPGDDGEVNIVGRIFGTPNAQDTLVARITYTPVGKEREEISQTHVDTVLRESVLTTSLEGVSEILSQGFTTVVMKIKNDHHHTIDEISAPFTFPSGVTLVSASSTHGTIQDSVWQIGTLNPNEEVQARVSLNFSLPKSQEQLELSLAPSVSVHGADYPQQAGKLLMEVLHPDVAVTTLWQTTHTTPGAQPLLTLTLTNSGDSPLSDIVVSIPIATGLVDGALFANKNHGVLQNGIVVLNSTSFPGLASLERGASVSLTLAVPIISVPTGSTNIAAVLSPRVTAAVSGVATARLEKTVTTPALPVGTSLSLSGTARYYTNDGNQLGRGPLPPRVGKETKYWVLLTIKNGTSAVSNLSLTGTLPSGVSWTGKTSVSAGNDIAFNPANRIVAYTLYSLAPHETVFVSMELAITPNQAQLGTTPLLLSNIGLNGTDTYINTDMVKTTTNINSSLPFDTIAQKKGVSVQEAALSFD